MRCSENKQKIHSIIDKLLKCDIERNTEEIFTNYINLVNIIGSSLIKTKDSFDQFNDEDVSTYLHQSRRFFHKWELYLESIMYAWFMHNTAPNSIPTTLFEKIKEYYITEYKNLVNGEIKAASIDHGSRVCQVGIGAMPSILNKKEIYEQIKKTSQNDVFLIDRKISGLSQYVYQSNDFDIPEPLLSTSSQFGLINMACYLIKNQEYTTC